MWNAVHIARALGYRRLAVASHGGHGAWGCRMMLNWGQPCSSLRMDEKAVRARVAGHEPALLSVRSGRQANWIPLDEKERQRARLTGRRVRPPSFLVYPAISILKFFGTTWIPHGPDKPSLVAWAERSAELHPMKLETGLETPPALLNQRRD
jgi:hypothetical protein